jgi:hypothetical protein
LLGSLLFHLVDPYGLDHRLHFVHVHVSVLGWFRTNLAEVPYFFAVVTLLSLPLNPYYT